MCSVQQQQALLSFCSFFCFALSLSTCMDWVWKQSLAASAGLANWLLNKFSVSVCNFSPSLCVFFDTLTVHFVPCHSNVLITGLLFPFVLPFVVLCEGLTPSSPGAIGGALWNPNFQVLQCFYIRFFLISHKDFRVPTPQFAKQHLPHVAALWTWLCVTWWTVLYFIYRFCFCSFVQQTDFQLNDYLMCISKLYF